MDPELINELYPTHGAKIGLLATFALAGASLLGAAWSARKGNYQQAIFRAVLWGTFTRNASDDLNTKLRLREVSNKTGKQPARRLGF